MPKNFNQLPDTDLDPILIANAKWPQFANEHERPINTTIGVVLDPETNKPWRPHAVQSALLEAAADIAHGGRFGYQPPAGHAGFIESAKSFVLPAGTPDVIGYQSLGGTSTLSLARDALVSIIPARRAVAHTLFLDGGWPNHPAVFEPLFNIESYDHADAETGTYNHGAAMEALNGAAWGSTALFQVSGYNDDGLDRTPVQWDDVLRTAVDKELTVVLDGAYIGLADKISVDSYPIQQAVELGALLVANSEAHMGDANAKKFDQTIKRLIRRNYSSPPLLVAEAAERALDDAMYYGELSIARENIIANRKLLAEIIGGDLPSTGNGRGLFTKLFNGGFTKEQHDVLKQEGIHALPNSRINIGGLNHDQVERVGEAILKAVRI
jgi:aspartate/tyrosine/aromatic aminotransferase